MLTYLHLKEEKNYISTWCGDLRQKKKGGAARGLSSLVGLWRRAAEMTARHVRLSWVTVSWFSFVFGVFLCFFFLFFFLLTLTLLDKPQEKGGRATSVSVNELRSRRSTLTQPRLRCCLNGDGVMVVSESHSGDTRLRIRKDHTS